MRQFKSLLSCSLLCAMLAACGGGTSAADSAATGAGSSTSASTHSSSGSSTSSSGGSSGSSSSTGSSGSSGSSSSGAHSALRITTTTCPGGTQGTAYSGCTIAATGGTPPYTYSVSTDSSYPPLPEGLLLDATNGHITSALIGGQGTYAPKLLVTDSAHVQASMQITFAINGGNA